MQHDASSTPFVPQIEEGSLILCCSGGESRFNPLCPTCPKALIFTVLSGDNNNMVVTTGTMNGLRLQAKVHDGQLFLPGPMSFPIKAVSCPANDIIIEITSNARRLPPEVLIAALGLGIF